MAEYTRDEALAFLDAVRLTVEGKVGFKWMVAKLSDLSAFVDSVTAENAALNEFVDSSGSREQYQAFLSSRM